MLVQVNDPRPDVSSLVGDLTARLKDALQRGVPPERTANLRVELDWIQYRSSFREPTIVRELTGDGEQRGWELAIDVRRARKDLASALERGVQELRDPDQARRGRLYLEDYGPLRDSIVWRFNRLYWEHVADWERMRGHGFEASLPGGGSDANDPAAIRDSVERLWMALSDLDAGGALGSEIHWLEIGVGSGRRAELWLDEFERLDRSRGVRLYPRMRFLLGDFSQVARERVQAKVARHAAVARSVHVDARDPLSALPDLRSRLFYVHLTNVYDNLPTNQFVRRGRELQHLEVRAYLPPLAAQRLREQSPGTDDLLRAVATLLDQGPTGLGDPERGLVFWRDLWDAIRFEERLLPIDDARAPGLPPGLDWRDLDRLLEPTTDDLRFHLSDGALESFVNTVPLLHPRGLLHVQDIFVADIAQYRSGFRGPGKLDGSLLNWVNGAALSAVGSRLGFDVRFAPFPYREGSMTSVLTATRR